MIGLLWPFRKLGDKLFRFVDLMTESISDFLDRYFESDQLKAVLAYYGSIGTFAGPRTPGTAYVLLHHLMGEHEGAGGWGFIRGGMGGISQAIARSAERHGARIRANAEVARITVRDGKAAGVVLASGEEIADPVVVSNADPRRTFLGMLGDRELPPEFVDEVRTYKTYSTAFKINLALDEAPRYTAFDAKTIGTVYPTYVHIGPSIEYLERAYDDAKYGRPSARPFPSPVVPTIVDPDLGPEGKHILNIFGGHAPYTLQGTTWDQERERFADTVIDTLAEYAPNLKGAVIHRQVLMPPDLEAVFGLATRPHLPRGALGRSALLPPAGARLRELPEPGPRPLPVRVGDASGRRGDGGVGAQRGAGDPEGRPAMSGHVPSYWAATAGPEPEGLGPLPGDRTADVAVLGGGYTGLAAAYRLAGDHGLDTVVLEAHAIGWGASGRNGGFAMISVGKLSHQEREAQVGAPGSATRVPARHRRVRARARAHRQGRSRLRRSARRLDQRRSSRGPGPGAPGATAHLPGTPRLPGGGVPGSRATGCRGLHAEPFRPRRPAHSPDLRAPSAEVRAEPGAGRPPSRCGDPPRLAGRAVGEGGAWHVLATPRGTVRARRVVVGTNGYTLESLHPFLRARTLPATSNIIVTRALTDAEWAEVGMRTTQVYTDTRTLVQYWRRLPDGRMLFGGRAGVINTEASLARRRRWLEGQLAAMFPCLQGIGSEYFWHGAVCMPYDRIPHAHTIDDDPTVAYALAYTGSGVAMATYLGGLAGDLAAGVPARARHAGDRNRAPALPAAALAPGVSGRRLYRVHPEGPVRMRLTREARVTALLLAPAGLFLGAAFVLPLAQLFRLSLGARVAGHSPPTAKSSAAWSTSACFSTPSSSPSS